MRLIMITLDHAQLRYEKVFNDLYIDVDTIKNLDIHGFTTVDTITTIIVIGKKHNVQFVFDEKLTKNNKYYRIYRHNNSKIISTLWLRIELTK